LTAPGVVLGERVGPFDGCIDGDLIRRYAAATKDPSSLVQEGAAVPAVAIVTQIWRAQETARPVIVPNEIERTMTGGLHGEHDIVLHRPIEPGEPLRIWVDGHGSRPAGQKAVVTLRYAAFDKRDELVAEQWWTTVFLGTTCAPAGEPAPDHAFPESARDRRVGAYSIDVDAGMAQRYAEVSGDWSDHHFSVEGARRSGFDRPFLHGLCTMALCAQGAVHLVADGDPTRVRRVAVRFATPTFIGEQLDVTLYDAGAPAYAFEATSAGATVVSHGRIELR
jgi:acyl dehydratase